MSPMRRKPDGEREAGPTWESLVERQIREAAERGEFDDLPHSGERLPLEDDSAAGAAAPGFHLLRQHGFAPPWIETDKEIRALLAARDALRARAQRGRLTQLARERVVTEMTRIVESANRAIARLNVEAPTLRQHRRPVDLDAELAALAAPDRTDAPLD